MLCRSDVNRFSIYMVRFLGNSLGMVCINCPRVPRSSTRSGFTLIELLAVIGILAVLLTFGLGISGSVSRKQAESLTQARTGVIATALEKYRAEFGSYPATDSNVSGVTVENLDPEVLLFQALAGLRSPSGEELANDDGDGIPEPDEKRPPFVSFEQLGVTRPDGTPVDTRSGDFDPRDVSEEYVLVDAWDQPLVYAFTLESRPGAPTNAWRAFGYLLYSVGFDGLDSGVPEDGIVPDDDSIEEEDRDNIYANSGN